MTISFRPGIREAVGTITGLAGASGSGKTMTALLYATGLAQGRKFAVIDTEARRALHYADHQALREAARASGLPDDQLVFDHADLGPPFSPARYREAIEQADQAGYPVIVIDSFSHEHEGDGGLMEWAEQLEQGVPKPGVDNPRTYGNGWQQDWQVPPVKSPGNWKEPKTAHKKLVSRLLQLRAHLVVCMRAEEKMQLTTEEFTDRNGNKRKKTVVIPAEERPLEERWHPICEKRFPYELTASFLLLPGNPGVPVPLKLQDQHKPFFPTDRPISADAGRQMAEWAGGGAPAPTQPPQGSPGTQQAGQPSAPASGAENAPQRITQDRYDELVSAGWNTAYQGMEAVKEWWSQLSRAEQAELKDVKEDWKAKAAEVDQNAQAGAEA
jgi:hypothetical protein